MKPENVKYEEKGKRKATRSWCESPRPPPHMCCHKLQGARAEGKTAGQRGAPRRMRSPHEHEDVLTCPSTCVSPHAALRGQTPFTEAFPGRQQTKGEGRSTLWQQSGEAKRGRGKVWGCRSKEEIPSDSPQPILTKAKQPTATTASPAPNKEPAARLAIFYQRNVLLKTTASQKKIGIYTPKT